MARKSRTVAPKVHDAIDELTAEKGIDPESIQRAIEEAISEAFRHQFKTDMPVRTDLKGNGDFTITAGKTVVENVNDPLTEIAQSDEESKGHGLGKTVYVEVTQSSVNDPNKMRDQFGRMAALLAKQIIRQRIRDAERRQVFEEYKGREGELIHGKVQRIRRGSIIVDLGRTEAILPRRELIQRENFRENDRIRAVIMEVRLDNRGSQVVLSRAHPDLVRRLFEMEVTEVYDGTVEIKAVAREAGNRSKVAVISKDSQVDPVGACVGQKGIRVQTIVKELGGEKIDIVYWDTEPSTFIRNALLPAECERVILTPETRTAEVVVPDDQLSLAIGKEGQNARLAAKLTEWAINIRGANEMSRARVKEFIEMTFGSGPEEMYVRLGIGAETAPVMESSGFTDLEKIISSSHAGLAEVLGEAGATETLGVAKQLWQEMQGKAAAMMQEREARSAPTVEKKEVGPFVLPDGEEANDLAELPDRLDALPGDQLDEVLRSDALKEWLRDKEATPDEITSLMDRYK